MAIDRWRPWGTVMERNPFDELQTEMNRLFDAFLGRPAPALETGSRFWMPSVDVWETNDELILSVDVPGVPEKEISLSITGDVLTLKGERRGNERPNRDGYVHGERPFGRFERSLRIPVPVEAERVKATYRDGVLDVRLPKAASSRPKEIKIAVA
ncbi:MAG TPA: Hsp20/alpha crystallin family protein [Methylomirabilota bacterium]|nr:Hsp20/alpha crystallin family protein [Methylomirabilota bacterium]